MESALENQRDKPPPQFPGPEESRIAMQTAIASCDRKKIEANQKVRELLKERGVTG